MIIGTLMALETCLILGQVSHNLLYSTKKLLTDILGPGEMARGMGSPRQVSNRRRRTREGPEPACVQTPLHRGWHTQEGRMN